MIAKLKLIKVRSQREINFIKMEIIISFECTINKLNIAWLVLFSFQIILFCEKSHFYDSKRGTYNFTLPRPPAPNYLL